MLYTRCIFVQNIGQVKIQLKKKPTILMRLVAEQLKFKKTAVSDVKVY